MNDKISLTLLRGVVFLFPIGMGAIEHWSSGLFILAFLASFFLLGWDWSLSQMCGSKIFMAFALYIVFALLSLVDATDVSAGVRRLEKLLFLPASFPVYLLLRRINVDLTGVLMGGLQMAGPFMAAMATYFVYSVGQPRAAAYYSPIIFGSLAMLIALLLLSGLWVGRFVGWQSCLGWFSFGCAGYAALLSGTRGAWLALPIVILLLSVYFFSWRKLIVTLLLAVVCVSSISLNDEAQRRFSQIGNNIQLFVKDGNVTTPVGLRFLMWQQSLMIWQKNPLLGVGIGNFRYEFGRTIKEQDIPVTTKFTHAHNIYLNALATTGFLGCFSMIMALFVLPAMHFSRVIRENREGLSYFNSITGLTLLVSYAVFGLTEGWLKLSAPTVAFSFMLCIFLASAPLNGTSNNMSTK